MRWDDKGDGRSEKGVQEDKGVQSRVSGGGVTRKGLWVHSTGVWGRLETSRH